VKWLHPGDLSSGLLTVIAELDRQELVIAIDSINLVFRFGEAQAGDSVGWGSH
jgi:hypothetical protein